MRNPLHKKYVPDVATFHANCESNYVRLMKILPDTEAGGEFRVEVGRDAHGRSMEIIFSILEVTRYTVTLRVTQTTGLAGVCPPPVMTLRAYNDARMVEVVAYQGAQNFQPSYDYPNGQMRHRDEKLELNRFLADWLGMCLQCGIITDQPLTFTS